jgi:glycosyltransferase involved in cell wall biosynthesis
MKPLIVSTYDSLGGAARAAQRLHIGLQTAGISSRMLVQYKKTDDDTIKGQSTKIGKSVAKIRSFCELIPVSMYQKRDLSLLFSTSYLPTPTTVGVINRLAPDIVNLHWCCDGFLQLESLLKLKMPIVWTLHDMWAFTGGCHYDLGCKKYEQTCGKCPALASNRSFDLSKWGWKRREKIFKQLQLTIVSPSKWLADCAKSSSLLNHCHIEVIPNGINTNIYKPLSKEIARDLLNLPTHKKLVLFGGVKAIDDRRKGFNYLYSALTKIKESPLGEEVELVIFGSSTSSLFNSLGLPVHCLGTLNDDISLVAAYSACDAFVAPSIQDNLPNTIVEAMACGTPCVAFRVGGIIDLIEHFENGYIAEPFKVEDLAEGIKWVLTHNNHQYVSKQCRKTIVDGFGSALQVSRYEKLFAQINSDQPLIKDLKSNINVI